MGFLQGHLVKNLIDYENYPADTKIMKTHHELECPVLDKIQEEVLDWVDRNTSYLTNPRDTSFWHLINDVDMMRHCPSLMRYMMSIKIPVREITIGVLTESMKDTGFVLHMGNPPLNLKINFPIYNTEDVWTEWYDIPVEDLNKLGILKNPHIKTFDAYNYDLGKIHNVVQDRYPCITRYNMHLHPIVFNSWIPHRVMPGPNAKYPRIMVATMPIKEPTHLLTK